MLSVINAGGRTIPAAYEDALIQLKMHGVETKTQYDKPTDPPTICATANITIYYPLEDPMIHKNFPGGIEDLREYVMELNGAKDNWVKCFSDKDDKRWEYTYHERLAHWGTWQDKITSVTERKLIKGRVYPKHGDQSLEVNQIEETLNKLKKDPFTRQAQMITWVPYLDTKVYDPPCLQRIWFFVTEIGGVRFLNTNISFRSNDAWGAFFMNAFGLTMFIKENFLDKLDGYRMGRINWQADNFHIYGKDRVDFENRFVAKLLDMKSDFNNRVMNFWCRDTQDYYKESEIKILEKIKNYKS